MSHIGERFGTLPGIPATDIGPLDERSLPVLVSIVTAVMIREPMSRNGDDPCRGLGTSCEARLARDRLGEGLLGQLFGESSIGVDSSDEVGVNARHRVVVPGAEGSLGREDGYDRPIVAAPHVWRHYRLL